MILQVNWGSEDPKPEIAEPEEGYTVPIIPPGGLSAEEWDELAKRGEA